jgi:hypothetical protein
MLRKTARRIAPGTLANLRTLRALDAQFADGPARFIRYEREIAALRREIDDLRRDNRHVAELYDVVFDWAKANAAARGVAPAVDATMTVQQVAGELRRADN